MRVVLQSVVALVVFLTPALGQPRKTISEEETELLGQQSLPLNPLPKEFTLTPEDSDQWRRGVSETCSAEAFLSHIEQPPPCLEKCDGVNARCAAQSVCCRVSHCATVCSLMPWTVTVAGRGVVTDLEEVHMLSEPDVRTEQTSEGDVSPTATDDHRELKTETPSPSPSPSPVGPPPLDQDKKREPKRHFKLTPWSPFNRRRGGLLRGFSRRIMDKIRRPKMPRMLSGFKLFST